MVRILTEPRNALTKQFQKLLEMENVELVFAPGALEAIADEAIARKTGARGLRSIIEACMRDVLFEIPSQGDVRRVVVTRETITDGAYPDVVSGNSDADVKEA